MKDSKERVLVVVPHNVRLGVAVFDVGELIHYGVKTIPLPRTVERIRLVTFRQVSDLLTAFDAHIALTKSLSLRQRGSSRQRAMRGAIRIAVARRKVPIKTISLSEIQSAFELPNYFAKRAIFAKARAVYPELAKYDRFQNRSQKEYYLPLLWAVAIGLAYQ